MCVFLCVHHCIVVVVVVVVIVHLWKLLYLNVTPLLFWFVPIDSTIHSYTP